MLSPVRHLIPDLGEISVRERLRASAGAMLGLLITGFVSRAALGTSEGLPLLIAPMGASAVLLFAVPSSPLAQPWSILGGNVIAAVIGITAARLIGDPIAAAALACACAIGAMLMLRCLHPPSGAVALTAVFGGPVVHAAGYGFAIWPVGLNSVLLVAVALAFNNVTGRRYPHLTRRLEQAGPSLQETTSPDAAVGAVLRRHDELFDVAPGDLSDLIEEVERFRDTSPGLRCSDVMQRDVEVVAADMPIDEALDRLIVQNRTAVPVIDPDGRFLGMLSQVDLLRHLRATRLGRRATKVFRRSIRFELQPSRVADIMSTPLVTAMPDSLLRDLMPTMSDGSVGCIPVLDPTSRLLGLVTTAEFLRVLSAERASDRLSADAGR